MKNLNVIYAGLLFLVAIASVNMANTFDVDIYGDIIAIDANRSEAFWLEDLGVNNTLSEVQNVSSSKVAVAVGYFDDDDKLDLMLGKDGGLGGWYEANGDNSLTWVANSSSTAVSNGMVVGDFDGDGTGDFLFLRPDEKLTWYECTGDNTLAWRSDPFDQGSLSKAITMGDIEGDGINDLIVAKTTGLNVYTPNGNYLDWKCKIDNEGHYIAAAIGDFDGDDYQDLFLVVRGDTSVEPEWNPDWNGVVWYEFLDDPTEPNSVAVPTGGPKLGFKEAMSVAIGDVDGDGVNELIIGNKDRQPTWYESDGDDSAVQVNGALPLYNVVDMAIVPAECLIRQSDLNGDCSVDLLDLTIMASEWLK